MPNIEQPQTVARLIADHVAGARNGDQRRRAAGAKRRRNRLFQCDA